MTRASAPYTWIGIGVSIVLCAAVVGAPPREKHAPKQEPEENLFVVENTQQAALGQPRVHVRLLDGEHGLTGEPVEEPFDFEMDDRRGRVHSILAFLDTGASGHVISQATAQRFGVEAQPEAVYHEVGLQGETQVGVTKAYTVALADCDGDANAPPPPVDQFEHAQKTIRLQLNREEPHPLMGMLGGELNVIGMPAIRKLVVEIDPAAMRRDQFDLEDFGRGPRVILHSTKKRVGVKDADLLMALEYMDFNRRKHPDNRDPLPELESNPMITGVLSTHGGATFTGDWLLDTGAAASIISVKHAHALGLYDPSGKPARPADFTLPLGGIGGAMKSADGFIIERVRIKAQRDRALEFRRVHVVVQNVSTKLDDGREVTLDGVLGMNLLLPSVSGLADLAAGGAEVKIDQGGFDRIWIDGARGILGLKMRDAGARERQTK